VEMMVKRESSESTLEQVIKGHLERVLQSTQGNRSQAAKILGLPLSTLRSKLKKLGIKAETRCGQLDQLHVNDSLP
jgi:DNA-binding NtrC family response regulator